MDPTERAARTGGEQPVPEPRGGRPAPPAVGYPPPAAAAVWQPPGPGGQRPGVPPSRSDPAGIGGPQGGPGPHAKAEERRRHRKLVLLIVTGVVLAVGMASGGVAFFLYDRATRLDRGNPGVVLYQYVQAEVNDGDPNRAALFACGGSPSFPEIENLVSDTRARADRAHVKITVGLADVTTRVAGNRALVAAKLTRSGQVGDVYQVDYQQWEFTMENRSGWRVCGAHRTS